MGRSTTTNPFDARQNVEAGIFLMKLRGTNDWLESKPCWNPERDD